MKRIDDQIWAGTSRNVFSVKEAEDLPPRLAAGWSEPGKDSDEEDDEDEHDLLQVVGNIGVIHISGGLVNEGGGYLKYYGLTGYPQIKAAISAAARNAEVKHIVLNIDSAGGSVSGCQDTGVFFRKIYTNLKPDSPFTGGFMASSAYWFGSSGCPSCGVYDPAVHLRAPIGPRATISAGDDPPPNPDDTSGLRLLSARPLFPSVSERCTTTS